MRQLILGRSALVNDLFKRSENKASVFYVVHAPTDDAPREHVNDEGDIYEPLPRRDVGRIAYPKDVGCRCVKLPVHAVQRTGWRLVRYGCSWFLPQMTPSMPMSFINLATVQRAISKPSRRN